MNTNQSAAKSNDMSKMNMGSMGGMSSMSMSMAINWNTHCVIFLFNNFHAKNIYQFMLGCVVVIALGIFGQLLQLAIIKNFIMGKPKITEQNSSVQKNKVVEANKEQIDSDRKFNDRITLKTSKNNYQQIKYALTIRKLRTVLYHFVYSLISLVMMLLAMTMNGYVIICVALGAAIGKSIIIFSKSSIQNQKEILQDQHC